MTHLMRGGKYDTSLAANLLLIPTVKKVLKSASISQIYERISYGTFFMAHGVVSYALNLVILCPRLSHLCPRLSQSCPPFSRFAGSRELPQLEPLDGFSRLWLQ